MKVRMTADQWGCPDGRNEHMYEAGREYELPSHLATAFIHDIGCAHPVDELKSMELEANKMLEPAENKARRGRPRKVQ